MVGKFLDDSDVSNKKGFNGFVPYFSGSPQAHKGPMFHLDTSGIKSKK